MASRSLLTLIVAIAVSVGGCSHHSSPSLPEMEASTVSVTDALSGSAYVEKSAGLSFAVYRDGAVLEQGAFGVADMETGRPMTANTPLRLASITKPVAALVLLDAVKSKKIELDESLWSAAPAFASKCPDAKAFFTQQKLPFMDGIDCGDERVTLDAVITHTASAPVGSEFRYNGFLFGRLEEPIIRALDATALEPIIRKKLIDPLRLVDAAAGIEDATGKDVIFRLARPHKLVGDQSLEPQDFLDDEINAGAGMIASAPDAARLLSALMAGEVFHPSILDEFTNRPQLADGSLSPYGRGVFVERLKGRDLVWHTGWQPGAYTGIWIHDLKTSSGIIILSNTDLQNVTGDFAGHTLADNGLAEIFFTWLESWANSGS